MNINEYLNNNRRVLTKDLVAIAPAVVCKDGATLSVQASGSHYCTPRDMVGPYTTVEVGFPEGLTPAELDQLLFEYADYNGEGNRPDVYAYVPVELVEAIIDAHGGLKE
jgi:hypothetical protein